MEKPDTQTLERLYLQEGKSMAEVGRLYEVHKAQVRRWLVQAAIPSRSNSEGVKLAMRGWTPSDEHREKMRQNAAVARAKLDDEGRRKQAEAQRGRKAPNKGKKWTPEERAAHMATRTTDEYRRAASERQKGEKSRLWRGGQTEAEKLRMQGWEWRARRKECYERDNWTCQDCKVKCSNKGPRRIQAHHVIRRRDGGTDDISNLVTLCLSCHHKREHRHADALFA
jgi:uncharacterized protein YjhX (UPF0386 family)